ncbi:MAG: hypothetical protein IJ910_04970 [Bacteroidaceae bacterium]|nr:hypothetical protein [Bacteroidaceae bacterium]
MTDTKSHKKATIDVTVTGDLTTYPDCPDDHHPHLIDLGLPSGTRWACCNVGADAPESYGGFYAWGETTEKDFTTIGVPTPIVMALKTLVMTLAATSPERNTTWLTCNGAVLG